MRHVAIMFAVLSLASTAGAQSALDMHWAPLPVKSYRLLAMSMDDDGMIWIGATHRVIHRYNPRTGTIENVPLPYDATACSCLCAGKKVYVLGQTYPKLIIYDRTSRKFRQVEYPSPKPDVWYGTEPVHGKYLYLFDRGGAGVIRWDTQQDTGSVAAYPYPTPFPGGGEYVASDNAVWCKIWELRSGLYPPLGIARLDVAQNKFTGWWSFPDDDDDKALKPYGDPSQTLFLPWSLRGKLRPFDVREKRWCKFIDVPRYGELFGFMGGPWRHGDRLYFSLSTYNGTPLGCDGKPYHFCNAIGEFDPKSGKFAFPELRVDDRSYYQIGYMYSARGHFFAEANNIREPDGTLNVSRVGEAAFWQTLKPTK